MSSFVGDAAIASATWQAFERLVARLLASEGYEYVSLVGRSGDGGADVLGLKDGRRWLLQVKRYQARIGGDVLGRTVAAARSYGADILVIVSKSGFPSELVRR